MYGISYSRLTRRTRRRIARTTSRRTSSSISSDLCLTSCSSFIVAPVSESSVAEFGADREGTPALHIVHRWTFAQALHDGVVVHDDKGVVLLDFRDIFDQDARQIEILSFPVARQILAAALDPAVGGDQAGTSDPDKGSQSQLFLLCHGDQFLEHVGQLRDCVRTADPFLVGMPPAFALPDGGLRQIGCLFQCQLHQPSANV